MLKQKLVFEAQRITPLVSGWFRPFSHTRKHTTLSYTAPQILLITGGNGFLGQHIIREVQRGNTVYSKIRVFDLHSYTNRLGHEQVMIPVESVIGDVSDLNDVTAAFTDVTSVMHIAAMVSFGAYPDIAGMHRVNVNGTSNVVSACLTHNVARLTLCSTVDVVIGHDAIIDGTEDSTRVPDRFLFPGYPLTKHLSEEIVLRANNTPLSDGRTLHTVALRANIMYGELDPYFVPNALTDASGTRGVLQRVGDCTSHTQVSYVGNVASAFVIADNRLQGNLADATNDTGTHLPSSSDGTHIVTDKVHGKAYFVPDNTPHQNIFNFLQPFLECRCMRLSHYKIPYGLVYYCLYVAELLLWLCYPFVRLISPWYKINPRISLASVVYLNKTFTFSAARAEKFLGYRPVYSHREAMRRSLDYYRKIKFGNK